MNTLRRLRCFWRVSEKEAAIGENTRRFNETAGAPFHLSLSMGGARFDGQNMKDFFSRMDKEMYAAKKEYYKTHERRKT